MTVGYFPAAFLALLFAGCGALVVDKNIALSVPTLSRGPCISIKGVYMDGGLLFGQLNDSSIGTPKKFSVISGFGRSVPQIALNAEQLNELKAVADRQVIVVQMKNYAAQRDRFNKNSVIEIYEGDAELSALLRGGDGVPYKKAVISCEHDNVGCNADGQLVLREVSRTGGAEMTPRQLSVSESVFIRHVDGGLEVKKHRKSWIGSTQRGSATEDEKFFCFQGRHRV